MFWHGAADKCASVPAQPSCEAVLASPSRQTAAVFSRQWKDTDFKYYQDEKGFVLEEKRKGAFKEVFEGKSAFLHGLDHRRFRSRGCLASCGYEFVSTNYEPVLRVEFVEDVGAFLRKASSLIITEK